MTIGGFDSLSCLVFTDVGVRGTVSWMSLSDVDFHVLVMTRVFKGWSGLPSQLQTHTAYVYIEIPADGSKKEAH